MDVVSVAANYLQRDSWIHRLNPLTKLFWSILMMILSFLFKDPLVLAVLFGSIVLVAQQARILPEMLPVFKGLLIFALLFLLFQIFLISEGRTLVILIPGTNYLRITDQGVVFSLAMVPVVHGVDFSGKSITWIIPFEVGGGTDAWARLYSPFLHKHFPGNPKVVIKNVPGGGSIIGGNYFHTKAPADGLWTFGNSGSTTFPYLLGQSAVK